MWKLQRTKNEELQGGKRELGTRLAKGIVYCQIKIALLLRRAERRLSLRQKKILLVTVFVAGCLYLAYILGEALMRQISRPVPDLRPDSLYLPLHPPEVMPRLPPDSASPLYNDSHGFLQLTNKFSL